MTRIDLEDAIFLCQELEPKLAAEGYHCAITGSVLFKGSSKKDLDLVVYPHKTSEQYADHAALLTKLGFTVEADRTEVHGRYGDSKIVFQTWFLNIRVDVFFLS